jgi:N-acetylmuramoyl-L-alanine amidase
MLIAMYAGHGGTDPGAVSGGFREKDLTLAVSNQAGAILRSWGYQVLHNRTTDVDRSITRDANLANQQGAAALVEIHLNSNVGAPATGTEAFISIRDRGPARALANAILQRISALGYVNRGVKTEINAAGEDRFGILRLTNMPATLVELAFINNPQDMARFDTGAMAWAVAAGVRDAMPINAGGNPCIPPYGGVLVRQGSRGEPVRQIQTCLNRVGGARLNTDGIFGPLTHAAVVAYQRAHGLTPDGIVGPLTWGNLFTRCMTI